MAGVGTFGAPRVVLHVPGRLRVTSAAYADGPVVVVSDCVDSVDVRPSDLPGLIAALQGLDDAYRDAT